MSEPLCVVVGAGHAAAQLVQSLRQEGWQGRITLVGEEPWLPYNRPPLSKSFLCGEKSVDDLLIRAAEGYRKLGVETLCGRRVEHIDRPAKQLVLDDGERLAYDKLALTLGARPRRIDLPGAHLPGFFYLRGIADVEAMRPFVRAGGRAVIVGGGYIGLETAAMLRQLGMEVSILEMGPRVLLRVTAPEVSAFYQRIHAEEGVRILCATMVSTVTGDGRVEEVHCANGLVLPADLVVMGIGVVPNVELAQEAGLKVSNGIEVDPRCLTSDPDIVAAGDCTWHYNPIYRRHLRLESVQNAVDQARVAAATLCGKAKEYNALPWFWSDQYDLKLQIAGLGEGHEELILRGDPRRERKFAAFYLKDNRLIAVDAVNMPQEFMLGKRFIAEGLPIDKARLADATVPMRELLPAR